MTTSPIPHKSPPLQQWHRATWDDWVIDVKGERVFAFQLNEKGEYKPCEQSRALAGLPISLLTETVQKLSGGTDTGAAAWFAQAIAHPPSDNSAEP